MSISKRIASCMLSAITSFLLINVAQAQTATTPPRIFYSDLESGPSNGGQSGQGAFVTIYGNNFGATQGKSVVTVGGVAAHSYLTWSDTKIAFQIGSTAVSGNIAVKVAGTSSNGAPFTVRAGHIYFVSTTGVDSQSGSYSQPWHSLTKARSTIAAGDIVYAMNGVSATTLDTSSAALAITHAGAVGKPMAIVAYPGATVTVGSATGQTYGVSASGNDSYWVLAGLTLRGASEAVDVAGASNWRLVANDISCPSGNGTAACVHTSSASQIKFLGNNVHDSGSTGAVNYQSVQFSGSNTVEAAWNKISNTRSCTALMFSGSNSYQHGLTVHDNYINNAVCDGISFANVDPSQSAVGAYNNIITHVGTGPAPGGVDNTYACINAAGSGKGTVLLVNNTMYDCGARANADSGGIAASTPVMASNNILNLLSGETYLAPSTSTSFVTGSNNLFFGAGAAPSAFSGSIDQNPQFVSVANANFRLLPSSSAIDAGTNTGVTTDYDGTARPQGNAIDIGAFESAGTSRVSAALTTDPTSLDFGSIATGTSTSQSVLLSNTGSANAIVSQLQLSSSSAGFSASGLTLPLTLTPGQSSSFTITYAPKTAGSSTASVSLISNAAISSLSLTGAATRQVLPPTTSPASPASSATSGSSSPLIVTAAAITKSAATTAAATAAAVAPNSLWSSTAQPIISDSGDPSAVEVGVKFTSDVSGSITGVRFFKSATNTGTHVGHLWTSSGTLLATAKFTAETASGWQQVNFASPVAITAGTVYTASYLAPAGHYADDQNYFASAAYNNAPLHALMNGTSGVNGVYLYGKKGGFPSQGWNSSNYWVDVVFSSIGTPTAKGTVAASPAALSFGNVTTGGSSTQNVTVTASTASVTISQATVTGTGFSVSGLTLPATIAAGQSATLQVKFAPTTTGSLTGSLALVTNASNTPAAITLTGSGVTQVGTVAASPAALSFGNVTTGSSSTQNVTVTASTASVTISQATVTGTGFSVSGLTLPATIAAGQSATLQVKFAPTTAASLTGSLTLVTNASNKPAAITLSGTGVTQVGTVAASPAALSFGNVTTGSSSTQNVTVTASTASVTISQATVTGTGFSVSGLTLPATIAAGQSATLQVKFAPTTAGGLTGSLTLVTNASNKPAAITLSGTGVASATTPPPTTHSVALTWTGSTSTGVSGYNVFRGSLAAGPFTNISGTATAVAGTTYTDTNVVAGTTYYYEVTTVGTSGSQSVDSAVVSATIPTP